MNDRIEKVKYLSTYNYLFSKLKTDRFTWENIRVIFECRKELKGILKAVYLVR